MLNYLDGARSNKNKPNENFAREVMELFTLGEGHYTEQDIQQAAKAYTGWGLAKDRLHYEYHRGNHDDGPKTDLRPDRQFLRRRRAEPDLRQARVRASSSPRNSGASSCRTSRRSRSSTRSPRNSTTTAWTSST